MPGFGEFQPKTTAELNNARRHAENAMKNKAPVKKWPTVKTRKNRKSRKGTRRNRRAN